MANEPVTATVTREAPLATGFVPWALAGLIVGLAAAWILAARDEFWAVAVAAHLAVSALLVWAVWRRARRGRDDRLLMGLAATYPFIGALAPVVLLLLVPAYAWFRRTATPFAVWYRELFPDVERSLPSQIYQSISRREFPSRDAPPVVSYMDVMNHGRIEQRIAVIATVARNFRPVFAPVLKAAMADNNPEIRVQGASAIAKLTDDFVRRAQSLEAKLARSPDDSGLLRELAKAYDDYAFTGILDSDLEQKNRVRSADLWLRYCELVPADSDARLAVGRLLMRLQRYKVAEEWFERAIHERRASLPLLLWYMECLFILGKNETLRAVARTVAADTSHERKVSGNALSAARLWASPPAAKPIAQGPRS